MSDTPLPMRWLIVGILALVLVAIACDQTYEKSPQRAREAAADIVYTRDSRTGLCFAMLASMSHGGFYTTSIAAVPCEKVPASLLR